MEPVEEKLERDGDLVKVPREGIWGRWPRLAGIWSGGNEALLGWWRKKKKMGAREVGSKCAQRSSRRAESSKVKGRGPRRTPAAWAVLCSTADQGRKRKRQRGSHIGKTCHVIPKTGWFGFKGVKCPVSIVAWCKISVL